MPAKEKIRVLVADNFDIMRDAVCALLQRADDMEVAGGTIDFQSTSQSALHLSPDVIIMDDYLPPSDSADAIQRLRAAKVMTAILVISIHNEPRMIQEVLTNGAAGFVSKEEMMDHLFEAIRRVHQGEQYLSPQAKAALARGLHD